jgi:hypothetical protein
MTDVAAAAEYIVDQRIVNGTKSNYKSKLNVIKVFLASSEFSNELVDDEISVPLTDDAVKSLFGWLSVNTDLPRKRKRNEAIGDDDEEEDDSTVDNPEEQGASIFAYDKITISESCMGGYKSALLWYYQEHGVRMTTELDRWLNSFVQGYKKTIADKKMRGVMSIQEGKAPLYFSAYCEICRLLAILKPEGKKNTWHESIFAWSFMILSWNMLARSVSVGKIMLQHIDWAGDCMVINVPKHKGDQSGEGLGMDKHIYANPSNPEICPLLSLAVLIFCKHRTNDRRSHKLFVGDQSENRFVKILQNILKLVSNNIALVSYLANIGTHSNRKGGASYVLGLCDIISAVQVYLRAGWSLGNVQDRYIFGGAGADQLVGRAVAGLPINKKEFAILPPHFSRADSEFINDYGWDNVLEGYTIYPDTFKRVIPYLFASLVHHHDWLVSNLDAGHPLWLQRPYTTKIGGVTIVEYFKSRVLCGIYDCSDTKMQATGIPRDIIIAHQVASLEEKLKAFEETVDAKYTNHFTDIKNLIADVPLKVKDTLLENFTIDGVAPLSMSDVKRVISEALANGFEQFKSTIDARPNSEQASFGNDDRTQTQNSFQTFAWGGQMGRYVREDFRFPSCDCKTLWNIWFYGINNIQPLKNLVKFKRQQDVRDNQRVYLSRANKVITYLVSIALAKRLVESEAAISVLPLPESDAIFLSSYTELLRELYGDKINVARMMDTTYATIANVMYKKNIGNYV